MNHTALALLAAGMLAGLSLPAPAAAQDERRLAFVEENDSIITRADRHYTQGSLYSYLSPALGAGFWNDSFDDLALALPMFRRDAQAQRRYALGLGQSQFSPENLRRTAPDPADRPYAGWLYGELSWLQQEGDRLHALDLRLGVTGPAAGGRQLQNGFHHVFNFVEARGWDHQLPNRGAAQFGYSLRQRLPLGQIGRAAFDLVPEAGLELGTVLRDVEAGLLLRCGDALAADYGPERVSPGIGGTSFVDAARVPAGFGYSLFLGGQLRGVQYNRFIDDARQVAPRGLDREPAVIDLLAGAALWLPHRMQVNFSATRRSREFHTQHNDDFYGAVALSAGW